MKKTILAIILVILLVISLEGCSDVQQPNSKTGATGETLNILDEYTSKGGINIYDSTAGLEMAQTEKIQRKLDKNQPTVELDHSLSRDNLNKRMKMINDANHISYIYLINYGKVMSFYSIKGKVESVNSLLTTPQQAINGRSGGYWSTQILTSPDVDGTYGQNGPEGTIFFFTTEGVYVEWHGDYMVCDQPLKLTTQPELVRQIQ